jgi:hypothetical protein
MSGLQNLPFLYHYKLRSDRFNIRHNVGGQQHDLILAHITDDIGKPDALFRIKPGSRFVQYQYLRVVDDRLCDPDPPLHAARKSLHFPVCHF